MSKPIEGPPALSDEWMAIRSQIIGSSEAAAACGLSEYKTAFQLYLEKTGQAEPFAGNASTRRGRRYEPLIAEDWQELTGRKLRRYPCPMFLHPDHPGIAATPDGEIDDDEGLEIKSTTFRMKGKLGEEGTENIPYDWFAQAQQQMAVMNWKTVHFCILVDFEPCIYRVDRHDEIIAMMISAETELLERIRDRRPPAVNWSHPSTSKIIKAMKGGINDTRIELSPNETAIWEKFEALGRIEKAAKEARETLQEQIRFVLKSGNHFAGILPDGRMVRRKEICSQVPAHTRKYESLIAVKADAGRIVERIELPTLPAPKPIALDHQLETVKGQTV